MTWNFSCGFPAVAVVAALVSMLWAAPAAAQARAGDQCSAQLARVERALNSGRKIESSELKTLQGCLLSDPAIAKALARQSEAGNASAASVDASAIVLASFQNEFHCLDFNWFGTLSSSYQYFTSPFLGVYLGDPNSFTIYAWSASTEAPRLGLVVYSGFGLTLGASWIEWITAVNFSTGMQSSLTLVGSRVPSCPTGF
jgi:hypothetical protein